MRDGGRGGSGEPLLWRPLLLVNQARLGGLLRGEHGLLLLRGSLPSLVVSRGPNAQCQLKQQELVPHPQLSGLLDAQHRHHSLPAAQHAALKRLQLRRDVAAVALAHSTQPHPLATNTRTVSLPSLWA